MPKIVLTASSWESINFRPSKTVDVDADEWDEMEPQERNDYCNELADMFRLEVIDVGWEVQ